MEMQEIKKTKRGGFNTIFTHNGKRYYADLCYTMDCGNECMIFEIVGNIHKNPELLEKTK